MQSWESPYKEGSRADEKAFIFSIDKQKVYKVLYSEKAIFCKSIEGPTFGGNTLTIESDPMNKQNGC